MEFYLYVTLKLPQKFSKKKKCVINLSQQRPYKKKIFYKMRERDNDIVFLIKNLSQIKDR